MIGVKHIEIELTLTEQKIAEFIAKARYNNARKKDIPNNKKGPQSNYSTDLEGFASELAAAKLLNLYPDLQIDKVPNHDLIFKGVTIDVKATKYNSGRLIAGLNKNLKECDYYMLMVGTFPEYRCGGVASKKELLNKETITNLGWGNLHALEQHELKQIEEFKELIKNETH
jgi:hypothetical protein